MCLSPVKICNPKKKISLAGGDQYYILIPCGKCAECLKQKRDEWYFRSFYEASSCFDDNGYVYFDTLTYRDSELPHISEFVKLPKDVSDFSCFDVRDYRMFFVKLREYLKRLGFGSKNLKYFLTSEYGTSDEGTHRPHYHVLFFVRPDENGKLIDWLVFSKLVNKAWNKGRTDGIDYHPYKYVANHVFGKCSNHVSQDSLKMQNICNYVSKYITKESHFEKEVDDRLYRIYYNKYLAAGYKDDGDELLKDISQLCYYLGEDEYDKCKNLKKQMMQFHRQSHHFGEEFLKYNDYDEVFKTGMIKMKDKHNIVKHMPIPKYFQSKIWYDLVKDNGKAVRWELNDEGKKYKLSRIYPNIERMSMKMQSWIDSMKSYTYYCDDKEWYDRLINRFEYLRKGRSLEEFCSYLLLYKGRIKSPEWYKRTISSIFEGTPNYADDPIEFYLSPWQDMYLRQIHAGKVLGKAYLYNYSTASDKKMFGCKFITDKDLGDRFEWDSEGIPGYMSIWLAYKDNYKLSNGYSPSLLKVKGRGDALLGKCQDRDTAMLFRVVCDTDDPRFEGFDEMFDIYCQGQYYKNEFKQKSFDAKEDLKFRMKNILKK